MSQLFSQTEKEGDKKKEGKKVLKQYFSNTTVAHTISDPHAQTDTVLPQIHIYKCLSVRARLFQMSDGTQIV